MSGPQALVVQAADCPGEQLTFSEHEVARATKEARTQLRELRATDNFVRVVRDEAFIAIVLIDFGELGQREVLVDPLGIRDKLRPVSGTS
jgi:hypothetical protein